MICHLITYIHFLAIIMESDDNDMSNQNKNKRWNDLKHDTGRRIPCFGKEDTAEN